MLRSVSSPNVDLMPNQDLRLNLPIAQVTFTMAAVPCLAKVSITKIEMSLNRNMKNVLK